MGRLVDATTSRRTAASRTARPAGRSAAAQRSSPRQRAVVPRRLRLARAASSRRAAAPRSTSATASPIRRALLRAGDDGAATVHVRVDHAQPARRRSPSLDGGTFTADQGWAPSPKLSTLCQRCSRRSRAPSRWPLQFTVESGTAQIDDLFVDPFLDQGRRRDYAPRRGAAQRLGLRGGSRRERLEPGAHGYYAGGAGDELTLRDNVEAFRRWQLRPRMLVDVEHVHDRDDGARPRDVDAAARRAGRVPARRASRTARSRWRVRRRLRARSCASRRSRRRRRRRSPRSAAQRWFQLYVFRDEGVTHDLIAQARDDGFTRARADGRRAGARQPRARRAHRLRDPARASGRVARARRR